MLSWAILGALFLILLLFGPFGGTPGFIFARFGSVLVSFSKLFSSIFPGHVIDATAQALEGVDLLIPHNTLPHTTPKMPAALHPPHYNKLQPWHGGGQCAIALVVNYDIDMI